MWRDRVPEIQAMLLDGKLVKDIAYHYGVAYQTVSRAMHGHGIQKDGRRHWKLRRSEIKGLIEAGARRRDLASRYGVSENCISRALSHLGLRIATSTTPWTDEHLQIAVEARKRGLSYGQIAIKIPHKPMAIRKIVTRHCGSAV